MTIAVAYWCILIAVFLPLVWTTVAKRFGNTRYNNNDPRTWITKQENKSVHYANAAQLNAFENNPIFFASVLMAQFAHVAENTIAICAIVYVVTRILHGIFYITEKGGLRSLMWFVGLISSVTLIVLAALHISA